jgi:HK97 family phage portal protein
MRRLLNGSPKTSAGNVLVEIVRNSQGSVQELKIIDERFQIIQDDEMTYYDLETSQRLLRYDEVLHFKAWGFDGINGENPLVYLNNTFGRAISELRHAASYYGNGAQVDLVLETELPLNNEQRKIIEQSWEHKYSGPDSQGKTALLSHGVKAKPLGKGVNEADINSRKLTVEDISNITGVPLPLLAQIDGRYNLEFLNRLFVQYTLRGWCKRFESEMNSKLFSDRELGKIEVRFDLSGLMQGDLQAQASFFREMYNIRVLNPNEIRQQLGKNPYEGGDRYGMPLASNSTEVPQQPTDNVNTEEDAI